MPDYVVVDRDYRLMRQNAKPLQQPKSTDPTVDKRALRLAQLEKAYEMIRAKPFACATIIRLNYVPPPEPVQEERPPTPEPAKPVKGKKK